MPDNKQARTDDMAPATKKSHKVITTVVLLAVFIGAMWLIAFV